MKTKVLFISFFFAIQTLVAQKPKLLVGIVVDQMRYDYLNKFDAYFGNDGFKRLQREGANFHNCKYDFVPTFTGPGHASIYTGTTPANHGIIANDWYDYNSNQIIYCCTDTSVKTLGSASGAGQMSSKNLKVNSLGDAFHLTFGPESKVYGVSLKDRGAILPAGHSADAAYWFDGGKYGNWISSTQYFKTLPIWVQSYNASDRKDALINQTWKLSPELKGSNIADNKAWESKIQGKKDPVFPYDLSVLKKLNGNYSLLKAVPMGNDFTADFAKTLITEEGLGQDDIMDMLALSFSATDYVGHYFGTQSLEVADAYVRLDKTIAALLTFLDDKVGKNNYTLFLSSDHGAIDPPKFYEELKMPSGLLPENKIANELNTAINKKFGIDNAIGACINEQVFFNQNSTLNAKQKTNIGNFVIELLKQYQAIDFACWYKDIESEMGYYQQMGIKKGYYPGLSGEIVFALKPGYADYGETGSTHGTGFAYDTHIPFILFGNGIPSKNIYSNCHPQDIVPTLCNVLKCTLPWGSTGHSFMGELIGN